MTSINPADLLNTDNVLNDLQGSSIGEVVSRELSTTQAISAVLESYYTPNMVKDRVSGYIMRAEVSDSPIIYNQEQSMNWLAQAGGNLSKSVTVPAGMVFYKYYVALGSQLDCRDSGFSLEKNRPKNALTTKERISP